MKFEIKTEIDKTTISAILASVETIAKNYFESKKEVKHICLAMEETLNNISLIAGNEGYKIEITFSDDCNKFIVSILDRAMPGDFTAELTGDKSYGLTLLNNIVDKYQVENLGYHGRKQTFMKYYKAMYGASDNNQDDYISIATNFKIVEPDLEIARSVSHLFYNVFGFTYSWDIVYYPESYIEGIKKKWLHPLAMVDEKNIARGHIAVMPSEYYEGCYELGMALSDAKCRNMGIMTKLNNLIHEYIENNSEISMVYADCTVEHPYSQKSIAKMGYKPTGFQLQTMTPEMYVTSLKTNDDYDSGVLLCKVYDFAKQTIYLPRELNEIAKHIYRDLKLERLIKNEDEEINDKTNLVSDFITRSKAGIISLKQIGDDIEKSLDNAIFGLKKSEARLITIYCPANSGFNRLYKYAIKEDFFFTGIFPCTKDGDVIVMQKLLSSIVNYDSFQLIDEAKWILEEVKRLDPDINNR